MNFYLSKDGQKLGPYSADQIRVFLQQGLVSSTDTVWADGWPSWIAIANVPGLLGQTQNLPPSPGQALTSAPPIPTSTNTPLSYLTAQSSATNSICMMIHLSQFAAFVILIAGYVLPWILWQMNKDKDVKIDRCGRIVVNWILSSLLYDVIVICLLFVGIGFVFAPVLFAIEIIFPIIGAVKASRGEIWDYPLNIKFLSV
jgi:uncharacterized Tic20 family protein